jgi:hypothetical protein
VSRAGPSRLFLVFAVLWMVAMTWRLYPQFKDTIRVDGRLTTVSAYLDDSCGQRVGPGAATCLAESGEQAQLLLRSEQGKSIFLIIAPSLCYLLFQAAALIARKWGIFLAREPSAGKRR